MDVVKIIIYKTSSGAAPFLSWLTKLEMKTQAIIKTRIDRVKIGNFGDSKPIRGGDGIWELRINHGPGYRVYFGKRSNIVVVLLVGGDKDSQARDIAKAKQYWIESRDLL